MDGGSATVADSGSAVVAACRSRNHFPRVQLIQHCLSPMIPPSAVCLTDGVLHWCGHYPVAASYKSRDNHTREAHAIIGAWVFAPGVIPVLITGIIHYPTNLCNCFLLRIVGVALAFGLGLTPAGPTARCRVGSMCMLPPANL